MKDKPQQLEVQDFKPLQEICQRYMDEIAEKGYVDEDYRHCIFETAIECVFGEDVWKWINEQLIED